MLTFGDYHDLYILAEVLLLADVLDMAIPNFELDRFNFYSISGLA